MSDSTHVPNTIHPTPLRSMPPSGIQLVQPSIYTVTSTAFLQSVKSKYGITWSRRAIQDFSNLVYVGISIAKDGITFEDFKMIGNSVATLAAIAEDARHITDIKNEFSDLSTTEIIELAKTVVERIRHIVEMTNAAGVAFAPPLDAKNSIEAVKSMLDIMYSIAWNLWQSGIFSNGINVGTLISNLPMFISMFEQVRDFVKLIPRFSTSMNASDYVDIAKYFIDVVDKFLKNSINHEIL